MTETPTVIDAEATSVTDIPHRPFRVVSHKPGLVRTFDTFGGEQDLGGTIDPDTAEHGLWWVSQDWASQVLASGVKLPQLLAPTPGFLAGLDDRWLHRRVGHLRKRDVPGFYAKHPDLIVDHPQVVLSTGTNRSELVPPVLVSAEQLASGLFPTGYDRLDDQVAVQVEQFLPCGVEARYWVAHGEVSAACAYRIGEIGWESTLFTEMIFHPEGRRLLEQADVFAADFAAGGFPTPPGYVFDVGVTMDGVATVVRVWPSWAVEPLSASPIGVFRSLLAGHDFDLDFTTNDVWRWNPDLRVFDRSDFTENPQQQPEEDRHA